MNLRVFDSTPLAQAPDQEQAIQLEILRRRVMEYWVDGVLKHSLYNEVLISLGKREVDKAVDAPWKYTVEVSDATNSLHWKIEMSAPYMTRRVYCSSWASRVLARPQPCSIWLGLSLSAPETTSRSGCQS